MPITSGQRGPGVLLSAMPLRRFPKPWTVEQTPSGYLLIDANGIVLAHVYGQPDGAIAVSDNPIWAKPDAWFGGTGHYPLYTRTDRNCATPLVRFLC
jgi:hypothetical protein